MTCFTAANSNVQSSVQDDDSDAISGEDLSFDWGSEFDDEEDADGIYQVTSRLLFGDRQAFFPSRTPALLI